MVITWTLWPRSLARMQTARVEVGEPVRQNTTAERPARPNPAAEQELQDLRGRFEMFAITRVRRPGGGWYAWACFNLPPEAARRVEVDINRRLVAKDAEDLVNEMTTLLGTCAMALETAGLTAAPTMAPTTAETRDPEAAEPVPAPRLSAGQFGRDERGPVLALPCAIPVSPGRDLP